MVQLKKKAVLLIGALMLLLGMGMNLQYALDDWGETESCILQTGSGITNSVKRTCNVQYVCPKCGCIPAACGEVFYN